MMSLSTEYKLSLQNQKLYLLFILVRSSYDCLSSQVGMQQLVDSGRYDTHGNFTVILQPFLRGLSLPKLQVMSYKFEAPHFYNIFVFI